MLIIFFIIWMVSGVAAYFLERTLDDENGEPMSFWASLCMGLIGFMIVVAQISRTKL